MNDVNLAMNPTSRLITRYKAASLMLAVWLVLQVSGFANACLLEAPDHGGHQSSSQRSHIAELAAMPAHDNEHSSKGPCLKACDEGSQALQSSSGKYFEDPGSPPLAAVTWTGSALAVRHRGHVNVQLSLSEPPLRIIYSRWSL